MTTWTKQGSLATSTNTGLYVAADYWLEGYIDELEQPARADVSWNEAGALDVVVGLYVAGDYWLEGYVEELDEAGPADSSWNEEASVGTTWH